jgi:hypothetical protein
VAGVWDLSKEQTDVATLWYVTELRSQARFAAAAARHMDAAMRRVVANQAESIDDLFVGLHGLVAAAGNISKLLWPTPQHPSSVDRLHSLERGTMLRTLFNVDNASPLRLDGLREVVEHFDEHLDRTVEASRQGFSALMLNVVLDTERAVEAADGTVLHWGRVCIMEPATLRVFGHDLDVRALLHAMTELDSLAAQWLAAAI